MMNFNADMFAKMREATSLLQSQGPMAATAAIQQALQGMQMPGAGFAQPDWSDPLQRAPVMRDINPAPDRPAQPAPGATQANEAAAAASPAGDLLARLRQSFRDKWSAGLADVIDVTDFTNPADVQTDTGETSVDGKGRFIAGSHTNRAGTRAYKLYIPSSYTGEATEALPMIVMLHGCKQNPDDFAAGTQMNRVAEENNCFVLYPGQAQNANGSNCWNWFKSGDQQRDAGEPSIIADMTREILRSHKIDPRRVYIAGLSAGGAMATVMANSYPELYAAVGIHSGLPHGAAHDMPSAFAAMRGGAAALKSGQAVPVIVFHGDRDHTVHPRNGDQALAQCVADGAPKASRADQRGRPQVKVEKGTVPNGHAYTRVIRQDDDGRAIAEQWTIHGAGHAWSGGSRKGSYTDPKGPNAAQEMVRFFYTHANRGH